MGLTPLLHFTPNGTDEDVDCVLLTRFNLPSEGVESAIRARDGWLEGRVPLFEKYCAPSVRAQNVARLQWLVYFDPDSPGWLKAWIDDLSPGLFVPIFRRTVSVQDLREDMRQAVPNRSSTLITANLDNDDGLSHDFMDRLSRVNTPETRTAIYLAHGLIKANDRLYLRSDRQNAFCAVKETWNEPVTCWVDWHNRLSHHMPVVVLGGEPGWLQVVHGGNVSNAVKGKQVSPTPYRDNFVGIETLSEPTIRELRVDRVRHLPLRYLRSTSRTGARRVAVAVLGKEGVNGLKLRWARLRDSRQPDRADSGVRRSNRGLDG